MIASDIGTTMANASRLGANADLLLQALENRAALATLEFEEARHGLTTALVWSVVSTLALFLAAITGTAVVAALFWDTPHRVTALVTLGLIELVVAGSGAWWVIAHWKRWQLFERLRDQLTKDSACLREILTPNPR